MWFGSCCSWEISVTGGSGRSTPFEQNLEIQPKFLVQASVPTGNKVPSDAKWYLPLRYHGHGRYTPLKRRNGLLHEYRTVLHYQTVCQHVPNHNGSLHDKSPF